MKGATIAHASGAAGITAIWDSPSTASSPPSPNPIVEQLVILPDVEKRLEAFVRVGHGIVVFPGGVGPPKRSYLLGILLHPDNAQIPFPLILTGPAGSAAYFDRIDEFLAVTLGPGAQRLYKIIIDDPVAVAREMVSRVAEVRAFRKANRDTLLNWLLKIDREFQGLFVPTLREHAQPRPAARPAGAFARSQPEASSVLGRRSQATSGTPAFAP